MEHIIKYYTGKSIPCMAFDSQEEADEFDSVFMEFYNNESKVKEFFNNLKYASIKAIWYNVDMGNSCVMMPDELLEVTENCIFVDNDEQDRDDIYNPVVTMLVNKALEYLK